jgi:membrane-bound lytic murein transglycosylase F
MGNVLIRGSILVFFVLALPTCRQSPAEERSFAKEPLVTIDLEEIRKKGYIEALVDNTSVSYFIYKGGPMGYEYELLKRLADHLKVDLKIKLVTGIEEAFDLLNKGEGDVLAFPLTVTTDRLKYVAFTNTLFNTCQVLVQKKPTNWRLQPPQVVAQKVIRNPVQLIGKEIHVIKGSSFQKRLENLSQEIGGQIIIHEDSAQAETESLIRKVATGEIKYTVTDQTLVIISASLQ